MNKTNPKTWSELLEAGYVIELSEEQIAIAKDKFRPDPAPFRYLTPEENLDKNNEMEKKLRGLK